MSGPRGPLRGWRIGTLASSSMVVVCLALAAPSARAESVRSEVRSFLATGLPSTDEVQGSRPSTSGDSRAPAASSDEAAAAAEPADPGLPPAPPAAAPPVIAARPEMQMFGRRVSVEMGVESRMQVWLPAQHPSVHLAATPLRTYSFEMSAAVEGVFALHRLAIETDGSTWFGTSGASVAPALVSGDASAAAAALALVGLPFLRFGSASWWEPIVRYEVASYATTATPSSSVCLVPRDADTSADPPACTRTAGALRMASRFESFVAGIQLGRPEGWTFIHVGLDLVRQRKPYQVDISGRTLDDYLFDARFSGIGGALGFAVGRDLGLSVRGGVHIGGASVSLTNDLALEDVLPAGWDLEYFRWDATLAYGLVVWNGPPRLQLRLAADTSGSVFHYSTNVQGADTPSLSRDVFFGGRLAFAMAF